MRCEHNCCYLLPVGNFQQTITVNAHYIQDCYVKILRFQQILGFIKRGSPRNITHLQQLFQYIQDIRLVVYNEDLLAV